MGGGCTGGADRCGFDGIRDVGVHIITQNTTAPCDDNSSIIGLGLNVRPSGPPNLSLKTINRPTNESQQPAAAALRSDPGDVPVHL